MILGLDFGMDREYKTGPIEGYIEQIAYLNKFRERRERLFQTLTDREREILTRIASGLSNSEISTSLDISVYTVQNHRARIRDKLRISHQTEFVTYALAFGLINF